MTKNKKVTTADVSLAATDTTANTTTSVAEIAPVAATKRVIKLIFPRLQKTPKPAKEKKEGKRVTGATINVATTSYYNWRADAKKWGLDDLVNGEDKALPKKARFLPYTPEELLALGENTPKYAGYITVAPKYVDEVVSKLTKWNHDNEFNEDGTERPILERTITQFNLLENFVKVEPKPRSKKINTVAETEVTA